MYRFLACILGFFPSIAMALPVNWQMDFQESASTAMEKFVNLHNLLLVIIIAVVVFSELLSIHVSDAQ